MKKVIALLLAVMLLACCFAACGQEQKTPDNTPVQNDGTGNNDQPTNSQGETTPTATVKESVVWAQPSDVTSLDFHVGKNPASFDVTCNIFDTLVTWDAENKVIPHLATEWEFLDEDSL